MTNLLVVLGTVIGCMILLLLPAIVTGDWYKDRCEKIMRMEYPWI